MKPLDLTIEFDLTDEICKSMNLSNHAPRANMRITLNNYESANKMLSSILSSSNVTIEGNVEDILPSAEGHIAMCELLTEIINMTGK